MAFGGVATGNIKAQLAAKQTGTVSDTGSTPIPIATAPKTGKKVEVVATFEVTSVKKKLRRDSNIRKLEEQCSKHLAPLQSKYQVHLNLLSCNRQTSE